MDVVRKAGRAMDGADRIDVTAQGFPPVCQSWVIVHPWALHHARYGTLV
jgi:hypothetical protein